MLHTLMQLIGLALVIAGLYYAERLLARVYAGRSYVPRFKVWRDQLMILAGLTFVAVLLHFVGVHALGKLATITSHIVLVWLVRENLDSYVVSSESGKSALKLVSYMLIILILVQAIF